MGAESIEVCCRMLRQAEGAKGARSPSAFYYRLD